MQLAVDIPEGCDVDAPNENEDAAGAGPKLNDMIVRRYTFERSVKFKYPVKIIKFTGVGTNVVTC